MQLKRRKKLSRKVGTIFILHDSMVLSFSSAICVAVACFKKLRASKCHFQSYFTALFGVSEHEKKTLKRLKRKKIKIVQIEKSCVLAHGVQLPSYLNII